MKEMNKKGAEMTIGTIVVVVLAVIVLVILVYGFTTGWGNLWENIIGLFGGGNKVNAPAIIQGCQVACSTNDKYSFCSARKNVVFTTDKKDVKYNLNGAKTCNELMGSQYNTGLECTSINCGANTGMTCLGLNATACASVSSTTRCGVMWYTKADFDKMNSDVGVKPKIYASVDDYTSQVTDQSDINTNKASPYCLKVVWN